jgi:hypothetical protein
MLTVRIITSSYVVGNIIHLLVQRINRSWAYCTDAAVCPVIILEPTLEPVPIGKKLGNIVPPVAVNMVLVPLQIANLQ